MDIIVNLVSDIRSDGHKSFISSSEWAGWVFWPVGGGSFDNVVDLFLNTFVGNFFLGIKSNIESKLFGVDLSGIIREFTPVLDGGNVVLAHGVSSGNIVHIEHGLEDFDSVLIKSLNEIVFMDTLIGVVLAPLDHVLDWNNNSAVFNNRPDSLNNIIDGSFVLLNSDVEEISFNKFVVKGFDSIEFSHDVFAHAFVGDIVDDLVLIESSNTIDVNGSLDGKHVLPLLHVGGSIIITME